MGTANWGESLPYLRSETPNTFNRRHNKHVVCPASHSPLQQVWSIPTHCPPSHQAGLVSERGAWCLDQVQPNYLSSLFIASRRYCVTVAIPKTKVLCKFRSYETFLKQDPKVFLEPTLPALLTSAWLLHFHGHPVAISMMAGDSKLAAQ